MMENGKNNMENRDYVKAYTKRVRDLCEIVEEMFVRDKVILLSPIFRDMIIKEARKLLDFHKGISGYLEVAEFIKLSEKIKEELL